MNCTPSGLYGRIGDHQRAAARAGGVDIDLDHRLASLRTIDRRRLPQLQVVVPRRW